MKNASIKKNVILNVVRVFMSVIFPLITFPYATRVLGVDNIGKVQFGASIIIYFSLISALGMASYGVRECAAVRNNKVKFEKISNELFSINLLTTLFSYLVLLIVLFIPSTISEYKLLIGIQSLIMIFNTISVEWIYQALEDYAFITIRSIVVQVLSLLLMFLFVRKPEDYYIYALVTVLAESGMAVFNFLHIRKFTNLHFTWNMNFKKHWKPLVLLFSNLLAIQIYVHSDVIMLRFFTSDYNVGLYSLSVKVYSIIKRLINALVVVSIPRLSLYINNDNNSEYNALGQKMLNLCIIFVFPIVLGLCLLSNNIVLILSGGDYIGSVPSLKILSLSLLFAVIANFFANAILIVNKKDKLVFKSTMIGAVINIILNLFLIPLFSQNGAAITTVISEFIVSLMCIYYSIKFFEIRFIKSVVQSLLGCFGIVICYYFISKLGLSIMLETIIVVISGAVSYYVIMLLLKNSVVYEYTMCFINFIFKKNDIS